MFTKIRLIVITAATGIVLAVPTVASASAPDAKRFHGVEPAAKRFHGGSAGYRGWGSISPEAKRFHGIRPAGGRTGP